MKQLAENDSSFDLDLSRSWEAAGCNGARLRRIAEHESSVLGTSHIARDDQEDTAEVLSMLFLWSMSVLEEARYLFSIIISVQEVAQHNWLHQKTLVLTTPLHPAPKNPQPFPHKCWWFQQSKHSKQVLQQAFAIQSD